MAYSTVNKAHLEFQGQPKDATKVAVDQMHRFLDASAVNRLLLQLRMRPACTGSVLDKAYREVLLRQLYQALGTRIGRTLCPRLVWTRASEIEIRIARAHSSDLNGYTRTMHHEEKD